MTDKQFPLAAIAWVFVVFTAFSVMRYLYIIAVDLTQIVVRMGGTTTFFR